MLAKAFLPLLSVILPAAAQNSSETAGTYTGFPPCDTIISSGLSERILTASSPEYEPRIQSWWSANARYHPWCLFQPQTTQELSTAIKALAKAEHKAGNWHIAVRSGGHGYPGSNNVVNGVTIDLGKMNNSWYDAEKNIASIQPGAHWRDVYANLLEKYNITVTGGRDGDVGVGGFLLGGGISYYTGTNGFGCDTVVNYEVVLSNGSIIHANANENADLFKALKGGGSNFGIVTRFDVEAMPAVDLAYGQTIVAQAYSDDIVANLIDFNEKTADAPHDHLITLYTHTPEINDTVILSIRANTKGNLSTSSFDGLQKIPSLSSTWNTTTLAAAADASQILSGYRSSSATLTFLSHPSILNHAATLHNSLTTTLTTLLGAKSFLSTTILQPLPTSYAALSQLKGGNAMNLQSIGANAIMWTGGVGVSGDEAAFAIAEAEFLKMTTELKEMAEGEGALVGFVYMNYAHPGQDVVGGYGEGEREWLRGVAERYDGEGIWQGRLAGGFKVGREGGGWAL